MSGLPFLRSLDLLHFAPVDPEDVAKEVIRTNPDIWEEWREEAAHDENDVSLKLEALSATCSLQELSLNSTDIDDDAAAYISCCRSLEILEVAGTKLSSESTALRIDPRSRSVRQWTIHYHRCMPQTYHT